MGYEQVGGFIRFLKPKDFAIGQLMVEGTYLGKAENSYGEYHKFKDLSGHVVGLRGGHLDYLMDKVNPKTKVKVNYQGEFVLENGPFKGKSTHRFEVFQDTSDDNDEEPEGLTEEDRKAIRAYAKEQVELDFGGFA